MKLENYLKKCCKCNDYFIPSGMIKYKNGLICKKCNKIDSGGYFGN